MSKPEVIEKSPINVSILKDELNKIKKRDGELSFRGNKTEEYVNEFSTIKSKDAEVLFNEIQGMGVPRLKDVHIHKIIDLLPGSVEEVKVLLQGYSLPVTKENLQKISDAVKKHLPSKKK